MPALNKLARTLALVGALAVLASCSEYVDRRDSISLSAGNAVATDIDTQMVDPWPPASADRNIAFNGQKMQSAVQRYRNNQVIQPSGTGTSSTYSQQSSTNPVTPPDPIGSPAPTPKSP